MEVKCAVCGYNFHPDDIVMIKGLPVCETCKPFLLKRLQEGDNEVYGFVYKGFWIRFVARLIDVFIQGIFNTIITGFLNISINNNLSWIGMGYAFTVFFTLAYYVFFNGKYGATPGKMVIGAKIVNTDGTPISYQKAFARYLAEILSSIPFGFGYIVIAFDSKKRALHDRICGTMVIQR